MKKNLLTLTSLLCFANAWGDSIVIGDNTNPNAYPFGGAFTGNPGTRYQQAYTAADFTSVGAISISSIDFLGGSGGTLAATTYSLSFSTITAGIDTLSDTDFDSNLGPDNTLFTSVALSGAAPATLTFTGTPYVYNPANGNLLLDIIVSPGGQITTGASYEASLGSSAYSRYHNFGIGTTGYGLVTQFDFTPVPEPASTALLGLACVLIGLVHSNRLNRWHTEGGKR